MAFIKAKVAGVFPFDPATPAISRHDGFSEKGGTCNRDLSSTGGKPGVS
jgi:hypothetical protein